MSNDLKEKLQDATAAFTFSRLPREQRIAKTLFMILTARNITRKPQATPAGDGYVPDLQNIGLSGIVDLVSISEEIAQYSVKDFAVRYGHLADGKA